MPPPPAAGEKVVLSGWLAKKAHANAFSSGKQWNRRFFVLTSPAPGLHSATLRYYAGDANLHGAAPRGEASVRTNSHVRVLDTDASLDDHGLDRRAFARRALGAATLGAALVAGVDVSPASAFGSGIPGYDINEKAREAQRSAIKDELAEQRELARIEKERRRAAREAAEAEAAAKAEAEAGAAQ